MQSKLAHVCMFLAAFLFGSAVLSAKADLFGDCREPKIHSDAEVNTVVLGFSHLGNDDSAPTGLAAQIAPLIAFDTLLAQLQYRYQSIAITLLANPAGDNRNNNPSCTSAEITRKLVGQLLPGHKLLLLEGNLFEDGKSIFVQTFLSIHYREPSEAAVVVWRRAEKTYRFTAGLPVNHVAFAAREVSRLEIEQVSAVYANRGVMREQPNRDLKAEPITGHQDRPFALYVDQITDGWVSLRAFDGTQFGWVNLGDLNSPWPLRQHLPELNLVDGVIGFLVDRKRDSAGVLPPDSNHVRLRLREFRERADGGREAPALALAQWMDSIISAQFSASINGTPVGPNIAEARMLEHELSDVTPD